jgi:hypothetical protein
MSETWGDAEIGQPDEPSVPSSPVEWVLGETEPDIPGQGEGKSEGSGRPEDVAEEGVPDQETLEEETPGAVSPTPADDV